MKPVEESGKTLGETLEDVIDSLPSGDATVALGSVLERLERDGFLLICILLTLPFMVPVSIPGMSTVFGLCILFIGMSVLFNIVPPLPRRLLGRRCHATKLKTALQNGVIWVHRIERFSRPRLLFISRGFFQERLSGFMLVVAALLLMAPLVLVPFSNTLPALALLFLAIGLLQRDGLCILFGHLASAATVAYFTLIAVGGGATVHHVFQQIVGKA